VHANSSQAGPPPAARAEADAWMSRGACRHEDPELFFPIAVTGPAMQQVSAAKTVCGRCPVQASCLSYALETRQDGIWGGTTGEERLAMRVRAAARLSARRARAQ
jgi:WhiB family redox-sensing transcriptional regulator